MDEATLYNNWIVGLAIAAVVILIAAALLILVWTAARRILRLAQAALALVTEIKENTQSVWALEQTNEVAGDILQEAREIETHAGAVAEALHKTQ